MTETTDLRDRKISRRSFLAKIGAGVGVASGLVIGSLVKVPTYRRETESVPVAKETPASAPVAKERPLEINDLLKDPAKYRNKTIVMQGIYLKIETVDRYITVGMWLDPLTQNFKFNQQRHHIRVGLRGYIHEDASGSSIKVVETSEVPPEQTTSPLPIVFAPPPQVGTTIGEILKYDVIGTWIIEKNNDINDPNNYRLSLRTASKAKKTEIGNR